MDATTKSAPPTKRVAVAASSSTTKVGLKKEAKVVVTAVKDVKADSSFFSAPKPKPKLPTFKKAAVPSLPAGGVGGTSGSAFPVANGMKEEVLDPFQEALKAMAKNRTASPAVSTPEPLGTSAPTGPLAKASKKRKSVTWAADDQLEKVRIIEKAIYDDDPADVKKFTYDIFKLRTHFVFRVSITCTVYAN